MSNSSSATYSTSCATSKKTGARYDTIVLDPPAFAKNRGALDGVYRDKRNQFARVEIAEPRRLAGDVFVFLSRRRKLVPANARRSRPRRSPPSASRRKRIQGRDHPILLTVPETYYLKCVILRVL